jgi:hypothetical protein
MTTLPTLRLPLRDLKRFCESKEGRKAIGCDCPVQAYLRHKTGVAHFVLSFAIFPSLCEPATHYTSKPLERFIKAADERRGGSWDYTADDALAVLKEMGVQ